ncbi:13225_t:CDS:2 [Gigaspora margarita]|uniref:13225_t:CDS:1 n=1 Tax=Gigaspora margarita TaxID=4874 RepID=A0ABM8VX35_GIGMA|nr:13225_t:CDS:2 [Gigaspora margarita]
MDFFLAIVSHADLVPGEIPGQRCTRLARLLTPEQFVELQEVIDKKFCNPLNAKQIPAALDFILKVTKDIITKEKEAKTKKIKHRVYKHYRKPVKLAHAKETDNISSKQEKKSHQKELSMNLHKNKKGLKIKNITQEKNNHRVLMEDEKKSIKGWHNSRKSLDRETLDCALEADEHKTIDHYLGSTGKAPKILKWPLKSAKSSARRIGTKDIKKKEDKRVKIGINPLITFLSFQRIEVKKDENSFEKAFADQDESSKRCRSISIAKVYTESISIRESKSNLSWK